MKKSFLFLWNSIKEYKYFYLLMLVAPMIGAIYKPIAYYAVKLMVDAITNVNGFSYKDLVTPFLLYLLTDLFMSGVWRASEVAQWKSEPYVQRGILINSLNRVLSFNFNFFQNTASGSITSKIKGLLDGYTELWAQLYYGITYWVLTSIAAGFSVFFINYQLGLLILVWSTIYVTMNYFFTLRINFLAKEQNDAKHNIIGDIADNITNIQSIKLFSNRKYEQQRLNERISNSFIPKEIALYKYHFKINIINDIVSILGIVFIIIFLVELKKANLITVGDFVFVFSMGFQFQDNLWRLMQEFHRFSNHLGDLRSSISVLEASQLEYNAPSKNLQANFHLINEKINNSSQPIIEFRNISFNYDNNKKIFNNLNFTINPGEKVGIVGYTGAGKSTLINLLLKIFRPQSGEVFVNGQNIAALDSDELRKLVAIIPQDISLFHRTMLENIRYGNLDAPDSEVLMASTKAYADEFINQLPENYNTLVGERGIKLSGGQRQRIAISRAILKNAPILILDEATSSLDSITEDYIQKSIKELIKGKTVLAIAHRLSTLKDMDRLIVIDKGRIVETGTHEELLNKEDSLYNKIWHTQYGLNHLK